jgi:phenylalanine-4-hydroxylase
VTKYHSKPVNHEGIVNWSEEEHSIWYELITRQQTIISSRACTAYLEGLALLNLPCSRVPQLPEINAVLQKETGWRVEPVNALISFDRFFDLLADKRFPVATFLRSREEFDYLQEPDFFHEVFGHCAMLTNPDFAHFTHVYGRLGQLASAEQRSYLARLYWFTVEFGLVRENAKIKIYGGGILSSPGETLYVLNSDRPVKHPFDIQRVLRTPYRIDIMQPVYYIVDDISELYRISERGLLQQIDLAMQSQLLAPLFSPKESSDAK